MGLEKMPYDSPPHPLICPCMKATHFVIHDTFVALLMPHFSRAADGRVGSEAAGVVAFFRSRKHNSKITPRSALPFEDPHFMYLDVGIFRLK